MSALALRLGAAATVLAAAASAPAWGPRVLRDTPWFGTERVEVVGARLLAPHEVLAASGIRMGESVWADPAGWETALRRHPVVAAAEVTRDLPHTLRIRVTEKRPAALVERGTLRPATADGEILPVDPARVPVDLPILRARVTEGPDRRVKEPAARRLLAETGRLASLDPALAARVSEVRPAGDGALLLALASPAAEVVVPEGAAVGRLRLLRAALADVARRPLGDSARGIVRLDLRFEDQVVVRFPVTVPPTPR